MRISCLLVGAEKIEVLPVANPGQQVDTEQVRERKHRSRLALRVRIHGVRFDRELGLHQAFDDIDGLPDTGRDKVPKCGDVRSEEHTSELPSLMRISYAVFCLKKKKTK